MMLRRKGDRAKMDEIILFGVFGFVLLAIGAWATWLYKV